MVFSQMRRVVSSPANLAEMAHRQRSRSVSNLLTCDSECVSAAGTAEHVVTRGVETVETFAKNAAPNISNSEPPRSGAAENRSHTLPLVSDVTTSRDCAVSEFVCSVAGESNAIDSTEQMMISMYFKHMLKLMNRETIDMENTARGAFVKLVTSFLVHHFTVFASSFLQHSAMSVMHVLPGSI